VTELGLLLEGRVVGERADDSCGAAGDMQPVVDVFQVLAHSSLGQAQLAGDLGVGPPGGDEEQQFPLPVGELGPVAAALLRVQIGLVQMRAQQYE
jgi:hypothetical protein